MFVSINETKWPIVIIKFNSTNITQNTFNDYLHNFIKLFEKNKCFNIIIDGSSITKFPIKYAIQHAKFLKKTKHLIEQYIQKSAVIIQNNKVKNIMNIITKIAPPTSDLIITDSINEARNHTLII